MVVEALAGYGVLHTPLETWVTFERAKHIVAVYAPSGLMPAYNFCLQQVSDKYAYAAVVESVLGPIGFLASFFNAKRQWDCSGLVGQACHQSGLAWANRLGMFSSPADILHSLAGQPTYGFPPLKKG